MLYRKLKWGSCDKEQIRSRKTLRRTLKDGQRKHVGQGAQAGGTPGQGGRHNPSQQHRSQAGRLLTHSLEQERAIWAGPVPPRQAKGGFCPLTNQVTRSISRGLARSGQRVHSAHSWRHWMPRGPAAGWGGPACVWAQETL